MVMNLVLGGWESLSLKSGCNLYSKKFRFCVQTVKKAHENLNPGFATITTTSSSPLNSAPFNTMYFQDREGPAVDVDAFLATSLPKMLMGALILFFNALAILGLIRSNRWMSSIRSSGGKGFYFLPQSTQGLLHSLFFAYLAMGVLTLYSQVSLSAFVLLEFRFVSEQGTECLAVNCAIITLSIAITLHLVSLAVDRLLASFLSYSKYTEMASGTVPLWLLAIWLPSLLLGALPLAGWRNTFNFCVFLHQFNDDYLRFVGGFFLAAIGCIPLLYIHFKCFVKRQHPLDIPIYRWHRKLQSHHRLTFISILALNAICWTPFHLYLILACQSCPFPSFGTGFLQEYLYIVALIPAILLPMIFSIRSSVLEQCASKISRIVRFRDTPNSRSETFSTYDNNPLSRFTINKKSPLFHIDDPSTSTTTTTVSSSIYRDTLTAKQKGNLFVPRYLPMNRPVTGHGHHPENIRNGLYLKNQRSAGRYKTSFANKCFERDQLSPTRSPSTQETDSQCGFPVAVPSTSSAFNNDQQQYHHYDYQEEPYYSQILSHTLPKKTTF